jgi:hypothetical protein
MAIYEVPASKNTPFICFDPGAGKLVITGESYPENAIDLFSPLFNKLDEYFTDESSGLNAEIRIDYQNTSSQKMMLELISRLQEAHDSHKPISLKLLYQDGDIDTIALWEVIMEDMTLDYQIIQCSE